MKTDHGDLAFSRDTEQEDVYAIPHKHSHICGLTKREYFAAMAMVGDCLWRTGPKHNPVHDTPELIAHDAVRMADALIAELNK